MIRSLTFVAAAAALILSPLSVAAQDRAYFGSEPGRPFSDAVRVGNTIYFGGRLGLGAEVRQMEPGPERVRAEVRLILDSFGELFEEVGVDYEDVVRATVYITDLEWYDALNEVYVEYFPENAPARAAVEVSGLVAGALVEISFIAVDD